MTANVVCCYFTEIANSPFSAESKQLIPLWHKSWSALGWNPIVLNESHALANPLYNDKIFEPSSNLFKGCSNCLIYLKTCYQRWFAYSSMANQYANIHWADYDVMNYSYRANEQIAENVSFDYSYCAGKANQATLNSLLRSIIDNAFAPEENYQSYNLKDNNDMFLLNHLQSFPVRRICSDPCGGLPVYSEAALVHFHGGIVHRMPQLQLSGKTRVEIIDTLRKV